MRVSLHIARKAPLALAALSLTLLAFSAGAHSASRTAQAKSALQAYQTGKYDHALNLYDSAGAGLPELPELDFNKGVTQAQMGDLERATQNLDKATTSESKEVSSSAYYNLGNALYNQQKLPEAIEAYKNALRRDPNNENAKYNLELALKQQKQAPDSSQKKDDKQGDQKKDQQKQDQNKDKQDDKQQQKQDKQDQQQQQKPDSSQQKPQNQQQQQQQQPKPQQMSKEDAERLLNALRDDEMKHQKNRQLISTKVYLGKEW